MTSPMLRERATNYATRPFRCGIDWDYSSYSEKRAHVMIAEVIGG